VNSASGLVIWIFGSIGFTYLWLWSRDLNLNISFGSVFLLVVSGAIASALLTSGYFLQSFASIGLTGAALYYLERKEKKSQSILQDRPIY
jgi:hypothetical protein